MANLAQEFAIDKGEKAVILETVIQKAYFSQISSCPVFGVEIGKMGKIGDYRPFSVENGG